MKFRFLAAALTAFMALPALAQAASGIATANVNMRSGPSTAYPAVVVIPAGARLEIHGCLESPAWCDVSFARGRGWVSGNYIQATYGRERFRVDRNYYQRLNIPIIRFDLDTYWDRFYRQRDFYRERNDWRRGPDRRPPPPPPGWQGGERPRGDRDRDRDDWRDGPPPRPGQVRPLPPRDDRERPGRPRWEDNGRTQEWRPDRREPERPRREPQQIRPEPPRPEQPRVVEPPRVEPERPRPPEGRPERPDRPERPNRPDRPERPPQAGGEQPPAPPRGGPPPCPPGQVCQ